VRPEWGPSYRDIRVEDTAGLACLLRWSSSWELSKTLPSTFFFISSLFSYHTVPTEEEEVHRLQIPLVTHSLQPALSRPGFHYLDKSITIRHRVGVGGWSKTTTTTSSQSVSHWGYLSFTSQPREKTPWDVPK
jgi:hypothetical protein